jgi:hypothetical protein
LRLGAAAPSVAAYAVQNIAPLAGENTSIDKLKGLNGWMGEAAADLQ